MINVLTQPSRWRVGLRSLQFRASLLIVLIILAMAGVNLLLSINAMNAVLYRTEHTRTRALAQSIAATSAETMAHDDENALERMAKRLLHTQGLAYVVFAEPSGRVVASAEVQPRLLDQVMADWPVQRDDNHLDLTQFASNDRLGLAWIDVTVPVWEASSELLANPAAGIKRGYIRLGLNVTDTRSKTRGIATGYIKAVLCMLALVIACSLVVTRHIIAPIRKIVKASRDVANGVMDAQVEVHTHDEIGELAEAFNVMADRVAETQLELLTLNAELERRIRDRTSELQELASRDPLTGLYNRRYFTEVMAREFTAAERYQRDLTVLMFDLDLFKEVNDRFGHRAGDEVLCLMSEAMLTAQRESDVSARFGGDEFILLLPQTCAKDASILSERINRRFLELAQTRMPSVPIGLSVGVASLKNTLSTSYEALIHEADIALYASKHMSHNRKTPTTPGALPTG